MKNNPTNKENKKLPIAPEYVLFGLIFVNFGPLKILPKVKPPTSVEIEIIIKNKNIYNPISFELSLIKNAEVKDKIKNDKPIIKNILLFTILCHS